MNRDTRTISRQELEGQRAYTTTIYLWLYPLNLCIEDNGLPSDAIPETSMGVDTKRISGQPLIDELRKRGWTVTEEATAGEAATTEPSKPDLAKAIDSQLFELVKAMVTGCAATDHPHLELGVVSVARRLLAEMRGGG